VFGNWQASFVINLSPYSFASPFFNGFAVSYDLCVLLQYTRCQDKVKGNIFLVCSIFRKINLSCLLLVDKNDSSLDDPLGILFRTFQTINI
jgi:hypothetical protein